jgi:hypothetical protein
METDYSLMWGERHYRWIKPQLFIEELLLDKQGKVPFDYSFYCFHGIVELVQLEFNEFSLLFDRNFKLLPIKYSLYPPYDGIVKAPSTFGEMLDIAEKLATQMPFVRVDLYDHRIPIFGEMTFTPTAGYGRMEPEIWEQRLARLILRRPEL